MIEIGTANDRKVYYQKYNADLQWYIDLPTVSWLCFVIISNRERQELNDISRRLINNNTCYVCCAGDQGELLHDYIDEEINIRDLGLGEETHLPPFDIMTTWHDEGIEHGFWFAIYTAYDYDAGINTVVCLNATNNDIELSLSELMARFNNGYIPPF